MRIWIVTVGEPLPREGVRDRLHRSGVLARYLIEQGHEVVWWGSAFDHFTKKHHYADDTTLQCAERFRMVLFHGCGYGRNVSFNRMKDHHQVGKKFAAAIKAETQKPDIILSSFPTIELSVESVRYGKEHGIPVILDIRDLWPDIFVDAAPRLLRGIARLPLLPLFRKTEEALAGCHGLIGISPGYLDWALQYAKRARRVSDGLFPLGYQKPTISPDNLAPAKVELQKLGVNPSKKICWFIGTFGRTYDLVPVIETARRLQAQGRTDIQFVLSGSGEDRGSYETLAKGLNNLVFTGWINAAQIAYMMSVAKIGIAAYVRGAPQGLPNKFFEYLSAGVPILSSLEGEAAEVLEEKRCGLNYLPEDAMDLSDKLTKLLEAPEELQLMGLRGKELFEREYSAEVIYPQLVKFLERNGETPKNYNRVSRNLNAELTI